MLQFTTKLNDLIWSKPMLFLILGAGIFFTIATRAVQFRKIKDMFHIMIDGKKSETGVRCWPRGYWQHRWRGYRHHLRRPRCHLLDVGGRPHRRCYLLR